MQPLSELPGDDVCYHTALHNCPIIRRKIQLRVFSIPFNFWILKWQYWQQNASIISFHSGPVGHLLVRPMKLGDEDCLVAFCKQGPAASPPPRSYHSTLVCIAIMQLPSVTLAMTRQTRHLHRLNSIKTCSIDTLCCLRSLGIKRSFSKHDAPHARKVVIKCSLI